MIQIDCINLWQRWHSMSWIPRWQSSLTACTRCTAQRPAVSSTSRLLRICASIGRRDLRCAFLWVETQVQRVHRANHPLSVSGPLQKKKSRVSAPGGAPQSLHSHESQSETGSFFGRLGHSSGCSSCCCCSKRSHSTLCTWLAQEGGRWSVVLSCGVEGGGRCGQM